MSKKMLIFYSFPFNFLWKSLMTLMTGTLMTGLDVYKRQTVWRANHPQRPRLGVIFAVAVRLVCDGLFQLLSLIHIYSTLNIQKNENLENNSADSHQHSDRYRYYARSNELLSLIHICEVMGWSLRTDADYARHGCPSGFADEHDS